MDSVDKLPISAPYTDTTSKTGLEEGAYVSSVNTPLLYPQAVGTPGPANNHVVYPQQRQERSKKRKFCVRLGHFALVVTLLWLFAPAVFHKFSHFVVSCSLLQLHTYHYDKLNVLSILALLLRTHGRLYPL